MAKVKSLYMDLVEDFYGRAATLVKDSETVEEAQDRVEKIEQRITEEGFDPTARRPIGERPESLKHIRSAQWKIKEREEQEE